MLEACNNNLEMAVTMFLDGGGIAEEPSTSSASVSAVRPHTEYEFIIYCSSYSLPKLTSCIFIKVRSTFEKHLRLKAFEKYVEIFVFTIP